MIRLALDPDGRLAGGRDLQLVGVVLSGDGELALRLACSRARDPSARSSITKPANMRRLTCKKVFAALLVSALVLMAPLVPVFPDVLQQTLAALFL